MKSIYDLMTELFGWDFTPTRRPFQQERQFHGGKHQASKRGYKHRHNLSLGQRKHAAFVKARGY